MNDRDIGAFENFPLSSRPLAPAETPTPDLLKLSRTGPKLTLFRKKNPIADLISRLSP
jgi:hypothetical protein